MHAGRFTCTLQWVSGHGCFTPLWGFPVAPSQNDGAVQHWALLIANLHMLMCDERMHVTQAFAASLGSFRPWVPRTCMVSGSGPTKAMPSSPQRRANVAFSDRNPYPGCIASTPISLQGWGRWLFYLRTLPSR